MMCLEKRSVCCVMVGVSLLAVACGSGVAAPRDGGSDAASEPMMDAGPTMTMADTGVVETDASVVCGDALCRSSLGETCLTCPLDCGECPSCSDAPTCTGALSVPVGTETLAQCSNAGASDPTNFACGSDLGIDGSDCADPQLRLRIRQIRIQQDSRFLDPNDYFAYCALTAEDGMHSELLTTDVLGVNTGDSGNSYNFSLAASVFWGQGDLYRSINNLTITYRCFLDTDRAALQGVLDDVSTRAMDAAEATAGEDAGYVFGTASAVSSVLSGLIGGGESSEILNVQQTISSEAFLSMTNGRNWEITQAIDRSNVTISVEAWGCALPATFNM